MSKVLIADDNELNLQLFTDLLTLKNIEVIAVNNGNEVISMAITHKPDLIISDIRLGDISGVDLIKKIKKTKEIDKTPIIAITAYIRDQDKTTLNKLGCEHYLSKPVTIEKFYSTIKNYIKI